MISNLNNTQTILDTSNDSIVIVDNYESIRGGRTLDATGYTPEVIKAGHVIIKDLVTDELKPMPINGNAYGEVPESHEAVGILIASILTAKPFAGIMIRGTVNQNASPYNPTAEIRTQLSQTIKFL